MYNATRSLKEGKEKEKLLSRFSYTNNTSTVFASVKWP